MYLTNHTFLSNSLSTRHNYPDQTLGPAIHFDLFHTEEVTGVPRNSVWPHETLVLFLVFFWGCGLSLGLLAPCPPKPFLVWLK
jgi:hypothetical protein